MPAKGSKPRSATDKGRGKAKAKAKEQPSAASTKSTKNADAGVKERATEKAPKRTQKATVQKGITSQKSKAQKDPKKYQAEVDEKQIQPKGKGTSKAPAKKNKDIKKSQAQGTSFVDGQGKVWNIPGIQVGDASEDNENPRVKTLVWDPEKSYVGTVKLQPKRPKPERKRWVHRGDPIMDQTKVPGEWRWNTEEPDLDPNDLEAQIQRCDERVQDGILPFLFVSKKKHLQERKDLKDKRMSNFPGRSWEVVQRLEGLLGMLDHLQRNGDDHKQMQNLAGLIMAYKKGKLQWNQGLVTYWSHGIQLCEPRPLDWDEFLRLNEQHDVHEGFWVEGVNRPRPAGQFPTVIQEYGSGWPGDTKIHLALRIPGAQQHVEFEFVDDTGADSMTVDSNADITALQDIVEAAGGHRPRKPPMTGYAVLLVANYQVVYNPVLLLEVNIIGPSGVPVFPNWDRIQVALSRAPPGEEIHRLNGPWLRQKLFTATVPDSLSDLWIGDADDLFDNINTDHVRPPGQRRALPDFDVEPVPIGVNRRLYPGEQRERVG
ncbi:hypothetical protein N7490_003564 [Penicillium lividum]|nr:hypothetical protein N7490_003564 [Penicillium lividum]